MSELLQDLKKLRPLLPPEDNWKFFLLLGLMFLASLLDAIGISAAPAFVTLVVQPSALKENPWIGPWFAGMPEEVTVSILLWASGALFAFVIFKNLFLTFVFYLQSKIVNLLRVKLSDRMFKAYQAAPYEWHLQRSSSDYLRSIQNDTAQVLIGVVLPLLTLIMSTIMTSFIVLVLLINTPGITIFALMTTAIGLLVVIRMLQKWLRRIGRTSWRETKEQTKAIQQGFGSLVDARINGCEAYLNKIHRDCLNRIAKAQLHYQTIQKSTPYAMESFAILGLLVILYLLVFSSDSLASVLPVIALMGAVMIRLKQVASQVAGSINQMNMARAFLPAIVNDLHELDEIEAVRRKRSSDTKLIGGFDNLRLSSVSYSYPNASVPAIRDISLEMNRGECIGLVGETGCGKSTLVNVILGLLMPQSGHVRVNGVDIERDMKGWLAQLGYIQQSVYLIDDTIMANVAFGLPEGDVDEKKLRSALKSACLEDFVGSLPDGLKTVVGEAGVRLSGGQRQRLGIARALYKNPAVLIMDEATSALDNRTELRVMTAIQRLKRNRTIIMIAHRLSTVENCDRLYFMDKGRLNSAGTYEQLKKSSPGFAKMASGSNAS